MARHTLKILRCEQVVIITSCKFLRFSDVSLKHAYVTKQVTDIKINLM